MSVKRYDVMSYSLDADGNTGPFVKYEDYAALEARCAALAAENAGLKSAIEKHADSYIMCGYCRTERDGKNDDVCEVLDSIPATDAFLAEVRAQGGAGASQRSAVMSIVDDSHLTDEVVNAAFEGTNFGREDFRTILAETVLKRAAGYHSGWTATTICMGLGLLSSKNQSATKLGLTFAFHHYYKPCVREALMPAEEAAQ